MDDQHTQRAIDCLRKDCATYRAILHAALDTLAEQYARTQLLEAQLEALREELRRYGATQMR